MQIYVYKTSLSQTFLCLEPLFLYPVITRKQQGITEYKHHVQHH